MLRGLGLRSQVIQRMSAGTPETETPNSESSWLKGWKVYSVSGQGDAGLTCGYSGHVLNFQTDSIDERRMGKGCLMMPMSFGSLTFCSLKTKRPCLDIGQANISSTLYFNVQYGKHSDVLIGVEVT